MNGQTHSLVCPFRVADACAILPRRAGKGSRAEAGTSSLFQDAELEAPAYLGRQPPGGERQLYRGVSTGQAGCLLLIASLTLLSFGITEHDATMILVGSVLIVVFVGVWVLMGRSFVNRHRND